MQIQARYACITLYKAAGQKKGFKKTKDRHKKALIGQRLCGVNEPGGMQNHNGPASAVLVQVPVVLPVRFPAVAAR